MKQHAEKTLPPFHYITVPSAFGTLGIIWREVEEKPKVYRLLLPHEPTPLTAIIQKTFTGASPLSCSAITELGEQIRSFLEGDVVDFDLGIIALEECSEFQKGVLLAEHGIPRGWVSTYARIARSLGNQGGARAVGQASAHNPFPLIIPCHRVTASGGKPGGYQGGLSMKRALLELEGVEFSPTGRALTDRIYY